MTEETVDVEKPSELELTAHIVSAYVQKNPVPAAQLPSVIANVASALRTLTSGSDQKQERLEPPVPIKKSITPDYLVSLEDGQRYKSLKRHLARYGLTPEEYRVKWGLPSNYPMVAPSYSAARSELAKKLGLGRKGAQQAPAKRGRKKAARGPAAT